MAKLPTRLNSALLPLGLVALVAGCGGGSMVSRPGGATFVPPPAGGGSTNTTQTAKATLTIYVPRRGSTLVRKPSYVSPGTSTVTVSVFPAGAPSPWPLPTSTTVPTPAPLPSGLIPTPVPVTMTVNAPLGNAQFYVNTYDSNGYLLSGALSSPVPISPAAPNSVNMTLNASVQCTQINGVGGGQGGGGSLTIYPLANQLTTQSATFTVTPCDIDGYVIPAGQQLANPLVFSKTAPVSAAGVVRVPQAPAPSPSSSPDLTFSPSTISTGGDTTVTVTYAAQKKSSPNWYLVPGGAINGVTQYATIKASPVSDIFITNQGDSTVSILNDLSGAITPVGYLLTPSGSGPSHIVGASSANGCNQGGQAAITDDTLGKISVLDLPLQAIDKPPTLPPQSAITTVSGVAGPVAAEGIVGCNVYIGVGGYLTSFFMPTKNLAATPNGPYNNSTDGLFHGYAPITAVGGLGSGVYVGLGQTGGYLNNMVNIGNAPLAAGPAIDAITPYDATHVAIAYHSSGGYLYFGLFDGTTVTQATPTTPTTTIAISAMAALNGNVYAIGSYPNNIIFDYVTTGAPSASQGTLAGLYPSGIAVDSIGQILVTDTNGGSATGTLDVYPYFSTMMPPRTQYTVGINPSGIAVFP